MVTLFLKTVLRHSQYNFLEWVHYSSKSLANNSKNSVINTSMLRGNRTERRDAENTALAFRAEAVRTQIANLDGILQHMKEHHRKDK